jgi:hypothetical protein
MADTSLQARLKRLFSTNVIVRRIAKNRLKAVDTNRLQSNGSLSSNSYIDRFTGLHRGQSGYATYNQTYNFHSSKLELFTDYEAMDMDPIIASALDIYADESTVKNAEGDTLAIATSNEEVRKVLHNLFYDIINIEYNLWPWVRNACKYGDFFLHLDIEDELGIINVTPLSAYEVRREDGYDPENPYAYRFIIEGPSGTYANFAGKPNRTEFESFQMAHFRLLSDTNFLPYGKSMIESGRKLFKQLSLMEDAMLIQRIMRAPERRIFKIDVGNIPPHEVDNYMNQIMSKMKKVPYMNEQTGDYNLKFNLQNMMEDYYLPVRGGESGTAIETLAGLTNEGQIEDIEYLRNKLHAALKIPKAFLGYDEGVEGKATLAAEDVRFARTIERIQKIFVSELTKIAIIHLYAQGFRDEDLIGFSLTLNNPSLIYEKQQLESLTTKIELAGKMRESQMFSEQWIYENIFDMSQHEWKSEQDNVIEDLKTQFRRKQIADEGNDPRKTNMSFGTPHDIASMHVATKGELLPGMEQEHVAGPGRPKDTSTWGKHSSPHGRDPLGAKDLSSTFNGSPKTDPLQHTFRKSSALSIESTESKALIKSLSNNFKSSSIIQESLDKKSVDPDAGTLLDESQLLSLND